VYDLGDPVTLTFDTDVDDAPVTPDSVVLEVDQPDGVVLEPTVTTVSTGRHAATFTPTQPGRHPFRWVATGPGARSHVDVFNVRAAVPLALCSLAVAKRHINIDSDEVVDDEELRVHIEAATGAVERHRGEVVARRTFTVEATGGQLLSLRPVISVTSATPVDGGGAIDVSGADWLPDPATGLVTIPDGTARSTVLVVAGYRVVPDEFILAAEIIAAHLWETQRARAVGSITGLPGEEAVLTPSGMGFAIPSRAITLLGGQPPVFG
jgi:hypothetical protein